MGSTNRFGMADSDTSDNGKTIIDNKEEGSSKPLLSKYSAFKGTTTTPADNANRINALSAAVHNPTLATPPSVAPLPDMPTLQSTIGIFIDKLHHNFHEPTLSPQETLLQMVRTHWDDLK